MKALHDLTSGDMPRLRIVLTTSRACGGAGQEGCKELGSQVTKALLLLLIADAPR